MTPGCCGGPGAGTEVLTALAEPGPACRVRLASCQELSPSRVRNGAVPGCPGWGPCSGGSDEELQPQVMLCLLCEVIMMRVRVGEWVSPLTCLICLRILFQLETRINNRFDSYLSSHQKRSKTNTCEKMP